NDSRYANFLPDRLLLKGTDSNFGKWRRVPETVSACFLRRC
ncbi:MAG: hypothetical protein QOD67_1996, partial [Caballeronia sp.]|nr:hypothetical protein [Caballeronia sp.]